MPDYRLVCGDALQTMRGMEAHVPFGDPNMVRKPRPGDYSPEETERLRAYAASGMSVVEAAALLGRSVPSIMSKSRKVNISWGWARTRAPWKHSEIATLRQLAKTHTVKEAAHVLGRTRDVVSKKASQLKISFQKYGEAYYKTKLSTAQIEELFVLKDQGWTSVQIAAHLNVHQSHVCNIWNFEKRYRDSLPFLLEQEP